MNHATRETYLASATEHLAPLFIAQGYPLPSVRASVGIPASGNAGHISQARTTQPKSLSALAKANP